MEIKQQMENRISEIADQLFKEGVEKGERQAEQLVAEATAKAEKIVADAQAKAKSIVDEAEAQAAESRRNVESELRMASAQALDALKAAAVDAVLAKCVDAPAAEALSNPDVVADLLKTVVAAWGSGKTGPLEAMLPAAGRDKLEKALKAALAKELKAGLTIAWSDRLRSGFRVQPADGGFKLSFTDEDFAEFFKDFLRARARALMFEA